MRTVLALTGYTAFLYGKKIIFENHINITESEAVYLNYLIKVEKLAV